MGGNSGGCSDSGGSCDYVAKSKCFMIIGITVVMAGRVKDRVVLMVVAVVMVVLSE